MYIGKGNQHCRGLSIDFSNLHKIIFDQKLKLLTDLRKFGIGKWKKSPII